MEKLTLKVEGMACEHCVKAVTNALKALPGVHSASVDLKAKTAKVEYDPKLATVEKMRSAIEDSGYEVVP